MKYEHLWADMHSNIHHGQMGQLEQWYRHAKEMMDFWPIAYYPFAIRVTPAGGELEDLIPEEQYRADPMLRRGGQLGCVRCASRQRPHRRREEKEEREP